MLHMCGVWPEPVMDGWGQRSARTNALVIHGQHGPVMALHYLLCISVSAAEWFSRLL